MYRRAFLSFFLVPSLGFGQPVPQARPAVSFWRYGSLLFLGTYHTNSPSDRQIPELRDHISNFESELVLVEGGTWPTVPDPSDAVAPYGELAYASNLAKKLGRRVEDADPNIELEHSHVAKSHSAEQAALYYSLRMVPQFTRAAQQGGRPVEASMTDWLGSAHLSDLPSLSPPLDTLDRLQALCSKELPSLGAWTNAADGRWWDSRAPEPLSFLQVVQATAAAFRDQFIADRVVAEMQANRRVIVVAGGAHLSAGRRLIPPMLNKP